MKSFSQMKSSFPLNQTFEKIEEAKLGEMLVRKGLITQAELAQVLGEQHIMLGQLIIQSGLISEVELYEALELQHGSNKKLGVILIENNLISQCQLEKILEKQYWRKKGFWLIS